MNKRQAKKRAHDVVALLIQEWLDRPGMYHEREEDEDRVEAAMVELRGYHEERGDNLGHEFVYRIVRVPR